MKRLTVFPGTAEYPAQTLKLQDIERNLGIKDALGTVGRGLHNEYVHIV